jgi:hypothetical protein
MESEDIGDILQTKYAVKIPVFISAIAEFEMDSFRKMGVLFRKNKISDSVAVELLFATNGNKDSSLSFALNNSCINALPDLFEEARFHPESVLKVMSALVADPIPESQPLNLSNYEFVIGLSYLAKDLLDDEKKDSLISKSFVEVQEIMDKEKRHFHPNWLKVFQLMKQFHKKYSGSTVLRSPVLASPETNQGVGRRLETYELKF